MNRRDFQTLARLRLQEAAALLEAGLPSGAYYLCGYAVECGLKACIARGTKRHDFPLSPREVRDVYSHEPPLLVRAAGLKDALEEEERRDPRFASNWGTAKTWSEQSRYTQIALIEAQALYDAVTERSHGVLRWIRRHW